MLGALFAVGTVGSGSLRHSEGRQHAFAFGNVVPIASATDIRSIAFLQRMAHSAQITTLLLRAQQRNSRSIDGTGIIPQFNVQGLALWPRDG